VSAGATLTSLTIVLKEDPAATGNLNQTAAKIQAQLVTDFFPDGQAARPYGERPKVDTSTAPVAGARAADGGWTFDLTPLVTGKDVTTLQGFAFVPVAGSDPSQTFEVVWSGKDPGAPKATFAASGTSSSDSGSLTPAPAFSSDSGSSSSGGLSGSGSSSTPAVATPPAATFTGGGSLLGTPPPATPDTAKPAVAPTPGPAAAAPRRIAVAKSKHGIPFVFIPAALALLALLGLSAVSLGEAGEPVAPRQGSVVRRLERRADAPA
jgi:hypothetical protein